jgi:hypothetical protein
MTAPATTPASNQTAADQRALHGYLRELRWALSTLPSADRDDIVAETESHLLDRVEGGMALASAIAALGPATRYARTFLDQQRAAEALGSGRLRDLVPLLAAGFARSLRSALALVVIVALWSPALVLIATAGVKVVHPEIAGLWRSPTFFFLGTIDDPSTGRELLGFWIFPLAATVTLLSWLVSRWLAARALAAR